LRKQDKTETATSQAATDPAVVAQPVLTADGAQAVDAEGRPLFTAPVVPVARTNPMAVVALVLGVLGGSILPIIFGHIARAQIRRTGESGAGMALAGLILGYATTVIGIGLLIVFLVLANSASSF